MKYGHFDDLNREYVITEPKTPFPWINYLGNEAFFGLVSNTAGGYCFYRDAKFRRLTRYRYNNVPMDVGGRYYYIKDGDTVWNPGWKPTQTTLDFYECRHGLSYSKFIGEKGEVKSELICFVPLGENAEVHKLVLKNNSAETKSLKLFSFAEWCLWNAQTDMENFQRNLSTGEVEIDGSVLYHKTEYKERRNHYAFFSVNAPIDGFDTDRESFIGLYNGFEKPAAILKGEPSNSVAHGWSPIASHYLEIHLKPGEQRELVFVLGYVENADDEKWESKGVINKVKANALIARFDSAEKVDAALTELAAYWDGLLSAYRVESGDEKVDRMVNIWNQYQCMVTFNMSRSASFFESGIGRGMGFRDFNQDLIGFVHLVPERAKQRILDIAATQFPDGSAYHQYQPLTKRGNADIGGNFNDDPLWLILSVSAYIKETGDWSLLDETVPFDNDENNAASLFEHLTRSFNFTVNHLGPHGLPLIGRADWNDCLNLNCFSTNPNESFQTTENQSGGVAESLMIAGEFVLYGREYITLCKLRGIETDEAQKQVDAMIEAVKKHGWDGEWFLRAYDFFGKPVGSKTNDEGKIFIESQGWCTMAGIGKNEGLCEKASVLEHLNRALEFTKTNTGAHGLPLLGFADWNDCVNLLGDAESVMIANLYGRALLEMIDLMEYLGAKPAANRYRADYAHMKQVVNDTCWDGGWFVRYFEEDGTPIGSSRNSEGQIYTNAQSWSVISGFADKDRTRQALNAVNEKLNTPCGIKLSWPGYNGFDPAKGGVTTYPPGAKENGGIFLHSNPWVMIAETMAGNGDRAFQYYNQINPAAQNDHIDRFECEPYCYPQNILGDEHPQFGLARNSWLSGTSSWTYQAATKHILGIMPTHRGLLIEPCIPKAWNGFKVIRKYRGATYKITVSNPEQVSKGIASIHVNGDEVFSPVIPIFEDGGIHSVDIVMGDPSNLYDTHDSLLLVETEGSNAL